MNCRKCGAALRKEQKVCIACGTLTPAGGNFYVEEDKRWIPTPKQKCAIGGVLLLLLVLLGMHLMRTVPPEMIAQKWVDLLVSRQVARARDFNTPEMESNLQTRMIDLRTLADDYNTLVQADQATYTVGKPTFSDPNNAAVGITFTDSEGTKTQVNLELIKQGRQWKINKVL